MILLGWVIMITCGRGESLCPDLVKTYSSERIDELSECLPELEPLFENENVNSGGQALQKKLEEMPEELRPAYLERVNSVFVYAEMIRLLGIGMPNGYHEFSWGLSETEKTYLKVLKGYSLDPSEADAGDVAGTLSTSDHTRVCVLFGGMLTEMPEKERVRFLGKLLKKVSSIRKGPEQE